MTLGAYQQTDHFAYPGWRLTVPGGPAGGHYKGFTHTQAAGTDIPPNDQYEQDREDGMSAHDTAHCTERNPRGVYRSSGEVPPRPNASGAAHTYRGFQTQHDPGDAVAPGSFPADFFETLEDAFLPALGVGYIPNQIDGPMSEMIRAREFNFNWRPPNTVAAPPIVPTESQIAAPTTGATSVVAQPAPIPIPLAPAPMAAVASAVPASPAPAPVVATNQAVPLNDGSGNYINVSTGAVIPASAVTQNPATGQLIASSASSAVSSALSWFEQSTIFSPLPNWGVLAGGLLFAAMAFGGKHR